MVSPRAILLALSLLSGGCTLLVDHQLSSGGDCSDLIFLDGTPNNGGQRFHGGVTAPSFRGPAWPQAGKPPDAFGGTLAFLSGGALELAGGTLGDQVFLRPETNYTPTAAAPAPGHEGPGLFGCAEVMAATYDALHDRTSLALVPAGCGDDVPIDGGTFSGAPASLSAAVAWAGAPDGGGLVATLLLSQAQVCPESFPLTCFPPHGSGAVVGGGERRMDSLLDSQGAPFWIVSTAGADVRLYTANFIGAIGVAPWSGPIAALASDVGIAMRIDSGQLDAQIFDAAGTHRGGEAHFALGDAAAHGLEIARFGTTPVLRVAWIGGDGQARVANFDASVATAPRLSTPAIVCGSKGASFVAPLSSTTAAVLIGDALYLRHVD